MHPDLWTLIALALLMFALAVAYYAGRFTQMVADQREYVMARRTGRRLEEE